MSYMPIGLCWFRVGELKDKTIRMIKSTITGMPRKGRMKKQGAMSQFRLN